MSPCVGIISEFFPRLPRRHRQELGTRNSPWRLCQSAVGRFCAGFHENHCNRSMCINHFLQQCFFISELCIWFNKIYEFRVHPSKIYLALKFFQGKSDRYLVMSVFAYDGFESFIFWVFYLFNLIFVIIILNYDYEFMQKLKCQQEFCDNWWVSI